MDVRIAPTRIGDPGQVYVAVQCGCGWSVVVTDPSKHEALYTLRDRAEQELRTHVESSGSTACEPWMQRRSAWQPGENHARLPHDRTDEIP